MREVFADAPIDAVMHFSAYAYVGESVVNPSKYYSNNVAAMINLLDEVVAAGIRKFVFSSTCATYGCPEQIPIPESCPQKPINPYGASKLMAEQILDDYDRAYGLKSIIFRYFNAAGADPAGRSGENHDPETHLIPLVLDVAATVRPHIEIFGDDYETHDGTCIRDYIHVTDLATAHLLGLNFLEREKISEKFNLGNGRGYSVYEIIESVQQVTGREISYVIKPRREGDPPVLVGDGGRARRKLGWEPAYADLYTIVLHAWKWHCSMVGSKKS